MIKEFSAGGIVFSSKGRSASGRKKQKEELLWLVCQHSQHKGWVFPKGLIGDHVEGELKETTALREVEEETGVKAKIIIPLKSPVSYFYAWQREKRFKTVYYFLMEYLDGDIKKHDLEMSAVEWWDEEKVKKDLTYKSDKEAFKEALKLL
ncbi:hypothetical protein A3D03_02200 [Candidatus Gottesmanbacteria bacterium RIFCSPHIGHO2_02_FULL_40_13]|uniref:Nudix hydrolase domain-containing protein n=1 Tax=Candidatus Gottesmanbacteria bacterium RIFCSPHIGHO2_02_FULL_40_13 TaxID=1798384 RepID=A0A1F6A6I5_9BACT|nr:MAG: hypothetical protein A3D03_02200 [Candidatus Gottesmanbacteria bacterium RIFCSPHIGHO2_02_FULL_40_13]